MSERKGIKDIAKEVRVNLKKEFPECKFSVTIERYSGGQALNVYLMSSKENVFVADYEYEQINHYYIDRNDALTNYGKEVLNKANELSNADNWDKSDSQVDYFFVNYYFHLSVGKWNKPYTYEDKD